MTLNESGTIIIFGGTGFVGRYLLRRIAKSGAQIRIVSHSRLPRPDLMVNCAVGQIEFRKLPANHEEWGSLFEGATHAVNLIGALNKAAKASLHYVNVELAQQIARYSKMYNIKRLIHISALIHKSNKSSYSASKFAGEQAVLAEFSRAVILKPSIIFGAEDKFLNLFRKIIRYSMIIPLIGGGKTKFQPIYVDDVAYAIEKCCNLDDYLICGKTLEIAGKNQYTMKQLMRILANKIGHRRLFMPIPFYISLFMAHCMKILPFEIVTPDQVRSLTSNSILTTSNGLDQLGIEPTQLHHALQKYMI